MQSKTDQHKARRKNDSIFADPITLDPHQEATVKFARTHDSVFDLSDAGTGKTLSWIAVADEFLQKNPGKRVLVLTTKTLMHAAWEEDAKKYGDLRIQICSAAERPYAWTKDADIHVANHAAVRELVSLKRGMIGAELTDYAKPFEGGLLIVDESTAYKNITAAQTKAALVLSKAFSQRAALTGFPNPNGVQDIWAQAFMLDGGERLGDSHQAFLYATHYTIKRNNRQIAIEKPEALEAVLDALSDITIRHRLDDCHDIPPMEYRFIPQELPLELASLYIDFDTEFQSELLNLKATNALTKLTKLVQLSTGVYIDDAGKERVVSRHRLDAVADLIEKLPASIVAYELTAFRRALCQMLDARGITYKVISGEITSAKKRAEIVEKFQRGEYRTLICHPKTVAHGATLTRSQHVIWVAPTANAEFWYQFNARVRRRGQGEKTTAHVFYTPKAREEKLVHLLKTKLHGFRVLDEFFKEALQ